MTRRTNEPKPIINLDDLERVERFWAKVEKTDGCWNWTAATSHGYGVFSQGVGNNAFAHRWSFVLAGGVIPDGLVLDHQCENTRCVRPDHLKPTTSVENAQRGDCKWKEYASRSECGRGHSYTEENTRWHKGGRWCRACQRERRAEKRQAAAA